MKGQTMTLTAQSSCIALIMILLCSLPSSAEDSFATILAPADDAKLEAKQNNKLDYEIKAAPKVDHVHLFVDGDEAGMAHKLKSSFKLGRLKPGDHKVCISPVNKNHTPIGAQACITVTV